MSSTSTSSAALAAAETSPQDEDSPPASRGGTAILGLVGRPDSLNPITEYDPALRELAPLLFDTLLRADPQTGRLQPGLAQSWTYTDDGQQVIFRLPAGLKWSNGDSLTAATIAGSLTATQHPALLAFSDITALDDETLAFTFTGVDCAAVSTLAQLPLLPAEEITATTPMGSGPFVVTGWSENKRTLNLAQNPNYHSTEPLLDNLTVHFIKNDEVAVALSEDQFDAVGPLQSSLPPYQSPIPNLQSKIENRKSKIVTYSAPQVVYLAINFDPKNDPPIAPQVRQALLLALDREAILAETLAGDGQLMAGPLLPGHWAANSSLSAPAYDPEAARTLLARAGLSDSDGDGWLDQNGQRLELSIRTNGQNPLHQNLGWLASSYYRDLGLFARSESVPFDSLVDDLFTHDFSLAIFSWPILPDPDQRLYWRSTENKEGIGLNFTSYNNPQLDKLLDRASGIPGCEAQARAEIYAEIQAVLAQDRPVDFLLAPNRHLLVNRRLHGLVPGPFAAFTWNVTEWYVQGE